MQELEEVLAMAKKDLNNPDLKNELSYRLGSCLHWIMDYQERVKTSFNDIPDEVISYFSALGYANNQLKHEVTLTRLYQRTGGFSFPISFPLVIPGIRFVWSLGSENQTGHANQLANYKKHFDNNDVMKTIENTLNILEAYRLS